jgi:hypothetical protein
MPGKVGRDINCAAASGPSAFDVYLGDETAESQASQANYLTAITSAERKYGWELVECRTALPYICEVAPDRCGALRTRRLRQGGRPAATLSLVPAAAAWLHLGPGRSGSVVVATAAVGTQRPMLLD